MNIANLDLCRELYELSGWTGTALLIGDTGPTLIGPVSSDRPPAYDADYLLRKMPVQVDTDYEHPTLSLSYIIPQSEWRAALGRWSAYADTPENALCALAIELFKQKILTPPTGRKV